MRFRDMGLKIASGNISIGNLNFTNIGEIISSIPSIIPELFRVPIAKNNAISVGNSFIVIFIPSSTPSINKSNTFFCFIIPNNII